MRYVFIVFCMIMLGGCSGSKDLEDRDFVMAVGIENNNDIYRIYTSVSKLSSNGEDIGKEEVIYTSTGKNIDDAIYRISKQTPGKLYLGHVTTMILDKEFDRFGDIVGYVNENEELGRDIVVVKSSDVGNMITAKSDEQVASKFIYKYFEDRVKVDLDTLINRHNHNEDISLPSAYIKDNKILIGNGVF